MLTQIVVLYMAYTYNLPTWCKVLLGIAIALNVIRILCNVYEAGEKSGL